MALKPFIVRSVEDALRVLSDRIRLVELRDRFTGNWSLVEDRGTGGLVAVRDNGQNVAKTIVPLATSTGSNAATTLVIGNYTISQIGVNLVATSNVVPFTVTVLAVP